MQSLCLLGSTGTIGIQTLDIVRQHPSHFRVFALGAYHNVEKMFAQCQEFSPSYAVLVDEKSARHLQEKLAQIDSKTQVLYGVESLCEIASAAECDTVLAAIMGSASLRPTMSAIRASKRVLLASKEALVMAGSIMMEAVRNSEAVLLPIDSEHNAILQCLSSDYLPGHPCPKSIKSITLTASGGPFRTLPLETLSTVTVEQAVTHPNWQMGEKISVDSATLMNKGLEVIQAKWLFDLAPDDIEVVIHPQSIFHAFVSYMDGSTIAHIAKPDMRIPIAYAIAWPDRIESGCLPLDPLALSGLEFFSPDIQRFPSLNLAYQAMRDGGQAATILCSANELAVDSFLKGRIPFTAIYETVAETLERFPKSYASTLEDIVELDREIRLFYEQILDVRID